MIHYCTYFDVNYLTRAIALYRSLRRHSAPFTLWALCLDDDAFRVLKALALDGVRPIRLTELEEADPDLAAVRETRTRVEYFFTCSPALPRYLLGTHPEIDLITYLDADLQFFSSTAPVFEAIRDGSVLIVPHRFPEHLKALEVYGVYNVGLLAFRNDVDGLRVLERWHTQCIAWCYDRVEDGRFADQKYLDAWPGQPGVVVLRHPGANLAPWNVMAHTVDATGDPPTVDGRPLVFYHFQGVRQIGPGLWDIRVDRYGTINRRLRARLYGGYVRELQSAAALVRSRTREDPQRARSLREPGPTARQMLERFRRGQVIVAPDWGSRGG